MTTAPMGLSDEFAVALDMARELPRDGAGLVGFGTVEVFGKDGTRKHVVPFANLITDIGDAYYAAKAIVGVPPASAAAPTALTGMQIGSGTTAASKSSTGAAMVTFLAGQAFDSGYPQVTNLGAGLGVSAVYRASYAAGTGTGSVSEATVTNGTVTTASTVANTIGRTVFTAVPKASTDSLVVTWSHKFLGA